MNQNRAHSNKKKSSCKFGFFKILKKTEIDIFLFFNIKGNITLKIEYFDRILNGVIFSGYIDLDKGYIG